MDVCKKYKLKLKGLFETNPSVNYTTMFNRFSESVLETNKLIGLDIGLMSKSDRHKWMGIYHKLFDAETKELEEAILSEDLAEIVKESVDVLVVGYMLYDLHTKHVGGLYGTLTSTENFLKSNDHKIDVQKAINFVLEENLSKFPTPDELLGTFDKGCTLEGVIANQCADLENGGRYQGVYHETVVDSEGRDRLVFWCSEEYGEPVKKYLKPRTFKKKDFNLVLR